MVKTLIDLNVSDGFVAVPTGDATIVGKVRDVLKRNGGSLFLEAFRQQVENSESGLGFRPYEIVKDTDPLVKQMEKLDFIMYRIRHGIVYERYIRST